MKQLILAAAALGAGGASRAGLRGHLRAHPLGQGRVELTVSTGSGNIHLTHGAGNQVHIFGQVKSGWGGSDERVREIAANPPIEQTGNIVRIGAHHENLHNISIDYEIQAPADAFLDAGSGSGNITDDGVGENAKLSTGSGNIHATGLHGGFTVDTGSGNIYAEQTGQGDVKAQTGSGNIELRNLHGGLRAGTGSGEHQGRPERRPSDWKLETGSGNVEFWPGRRRLHAGRLHRLRQHSHRPRDAHAGLV